MEIVFWCAAGAMAYTYAVYPALLFVLAWLQPRAPVEDPASELPPSVSLLVAAYNEAPVILRKLRNCELLDYPAAQLEIIFGSDGSDDGTADILQSAGLPAHMRLISFAERRGKPAVLNDLVLAARGALLVFSDANSMFDANALRELVRPFAAAAVGGVCGALRLERPKIEPSAAVANESLYWRYETFIKSLEGRLGILAAANGAIYAIRRELYCALPVQRLTSDDLLIGARVLQQDRRMVFAPQAIAREAANSTIREELRRRVRVGEAGFNAMADLWPLLLPHRGSVAWMLWSHKVLRWAVPVLLMLLLAASSALWRQAFYQAVLALQIAAYLAALAGYALEPYMRLPGWLTFPYFFAGSNLATLLGLWRSVRRSGNRAWARAGR